MAAGVVGADVGRLDVPVREEVLDPGHAVGQRTARDVRRERRRRVSGTNEELNSRDSRVIDDPGDGRAPWAVAIPPLSSHRTGSSPATQIPTSPLGSSHAATCSAPGPVRPPRRRSRRRDLATVERRAAVRWGLRSPRARSGAPPGARWGDGVGSTSGASTPRLPGAGRPGRLRLRARKRSSPAERDHQDSGGRADRQQPGRGRNPPARRSPRRSGPGSGPGWRGPSAPPGAGRGRS